MRGKESTLFPTIHPSQLLHIPKEQSQQIMAAKKQIFEDFKTFFNEVNQQHPQWQRDIVLSQYKQMQSPSS